MFTNGVLSIIFVLADMHTHTHTHAHAHTHTHTHTHTFAITICFQLGLLEIRMTFHLVHSRDNLGCLQ